MSLLAQRYLNPVCVIYQSEVRNSRFNICSEITAALPALSFSLMTLINSWYPQQAIPHAAFNEFSSTLCGLTLWRFVAMSRRPTGLCSAFPLWPGSHLEGNSELLCLILVWEKQVGKSGSHYSPTWKRLSHRTQMVPDFRLLATQWSSHESGTQNWYGPCSILPALPLHCPMPNST